MSEQGESSGAAVEPGRCEDRVCNHPWGCMGRIVMFWPGLAQKPRLWPGFRQLRLAKNPGWAKATSDGRLWPGSGLSRGLSTVNAKLQEQESQGIMVHNKGEWWVGAKNDAGRVVLGYSDRLRNPAPLEADRDNENIHDKVPMNADTTTPTSTVQMNADELCNNGYGQTQTCANEYV
ncbi:hypothetical protein EDB19DRAFT_2010381 [Suillus lakei]|nr:hypothetical protein EDB19DRAFT_2010381 [Suillus lakei]